MLHRKVRAHVVSHELPNHDAYVCVCVSARAAQHWEHHDHTGTVGEDPDFHHGDPRLLPWFIRHVRTLPQ
jgi:hypothetical protein